MYKLLIGGVAPYQNIPFQMDNIPQIHQLIVPKKKKKKVKFLQTRMKIWIVLPLTGAGRRFRASKQAVFFTTSVYIRYKEVESDNSTLQTRGRDQQFMLEQCRGLNGGMAVTFTSRPCTCHIAGCHFPAATSQCQRKIQWTGYACGSFSGTGPAKCALIVTNF